MAYVFIRNMNFLLFHFGIYVNDGENPTIYKVFCLRIAFIFGQYSIKEK